MPVVGQYILEPIGVSAAVTGGFSTCLRGGAVSNSEAIKHEDGDWLLCDGWNVGTSQPIGTGTVTLDINPSTFQIRLSPSFDLVPVPAGFKPLSLRTYLTWINDPVTLFNTARCDGIMGVIGTSRIRPIKIILNGVSHNFLFINETGVGGTTYIKQAPTPAVDVSSMSSASFLSSNFKVELANMNVAARNLGLLDQMILTGDYDLEAWTANVSVTPEQVSPDVKLTLTEPDGRLSEIDECSFFVQFNDLNGNLQTITLPCDYSFGNGFQMTLWLGRYIPYGGRLITLGAYVTSVEYTGVVILATLNQLLVDGSGIYKIVKDKRTDTYWDRSNPAAPVELDVKIPNPFIKTGFF